jgi:hypothetical protein
MSSPYTVYPDPAGNPYLVGVVCPHCDSDANQRCYTSGGNVYGELCHKKRKQAAQRQGVELQLVKPPTGEPGVDVTIPDKVSTLKLAFWFIEKSGGVERARVYFAAAASTLAGLPEEVDSL